MSITLALIVVIVALFAWSTYKRMTFFKKLGLPGPTPLPIVGNMLTYGQGMHTAHEIWSKKYGKTYGVFEGARKAIITSDLDIIEEVLIKQFNNFCDRQHFPLRPKLLQNDLLSLHGDRWKLMRGTISPTFSRSKMQKMASLVTNRADILLRNLDRVCDQGQRNVEISKILGSFVLESGALCAYATEIDSQNLADTTFVDMACLFFQGFKEQQHAWAITLMMPWMEPVLRLMGFSLHPMKALKFFQNLIMDIISERKADHNQKEYVDFLQLLMKAHNFQDEDTPKEERVEVDYKRALTDDEVTAMAVVFFLGNYETTTTTLCFIAYLLATHPDVQERLIKEIDDVIGERTALIYQDMAALPYLDMVLHESMRIYPPAVEFDRICQEDCVIKGIPIPKGVMMEIPIWVVHHDPETWPDPYTFDPERFAPEKRSKIHNVAWLPFGEGPRKCIGYRFAIMQTTFVLVRLLQKYRFETCEETEIPPKFGKHGLILPENGMTLRLAPRNK
ncbi:cytochrome P450 3A24-like [Acanthaster planci]|uniref:Cytochrome P450 3A24-like n=1 Tax=Acanthaster planci TaxID=133434 RepID=A0A8B7ZNQ3_ACAPL|nr:cytochrome P450 3A24-like [Acanthaster planci]